MLTVCAGSTDDSLTTTAFVKSILGVTGTSDDVRLGIYIKAASRWAESFVGYPLSAKYYAETVPAFDSRRLMLSQTPVRAVPVMLDATGDDAAQVLSSEFRLEAAAGFINRDEGWEWTVPVQAEMTLRPRPGQEFKPWYVEYVAGYTYGGMTTDSPLWSTEKGTTSTGRTLPEDIEQAVAFKAIAMYSGADTPTGAVVREALGDIDVWYSGSTGQNARKTGTPEEMLLEPYRRYV